MIEVKGIIKEYNSVVAVQETSFDIESGDFVTLVGPSGSGKSTLLRTIAGHQTPTSGKIFFNDNEITDMRPQARPTSLVFQTWGLFPHMTVEENINYPLKVRGEASEQRVNEVLTLVQLEYDEYAAKKPDELSGGEKQRVALARSLVYDPEILLLDEPLASLDRVLQKQLQRELADLNEQLNTTFVYVTHSLETALKLSDKIIVLHGDGMVMQIGSPEEIYSSPKNRFVAEFMGDCNLFSIDSVDKNGSSMTIDTPEFDTELMERTEGELGNPDFAMLRQHDCTVDSSLREDIGFRGTVYNTLLEGGQYLIETRSSETGREYIAEMSKNSFNEADINQGEEAYFQWSNDNITLLND